MTNLPMTVGTMPSGLNGPGASWNSPGGTPPAQVGSNVETEEDIVAVGPEEARADQVAVLNPDEG